MENVTARELKQHTGMILREVREHGKEVVITYRGVPVARLVPTRSGEAAKKVLESVWMEMDRLAEEIGRKWPEGISAEKAVSEQRREI